MNNREHVFGLYDNHNVLLTMMVLYSNDELLAHKAMRNVDFSFRNMKTHVCLLEVQENDLVIPSIFSNFSAIVRLAIPHMLAVRYNWPEDDWVSLTDNIDLHLHTELSSDNQEQDIADIVPVVNKRTACDFWVTIWSSAMCQSLVDFITMHVKV